MTIQTVYATTIEEFRDNRFQTNSWKDLNNAIGKPNQVWASCDYTVIDGQGYCPAQVYAHDFKIELPNQCIIKKITLEIRIDGVPDVQVPTAYFLHRGGVGHTGVSYSDDMYRQQPNEKLSPYFHDVKYEMSYSDIVRYKVSKERLESDNFGVILQFHESNNNGWVHLKHVRIRVEYDEPQYLCEIRSNALVSEEYLAPYNASFNPFETFSVLFYVHNTEYITSQPKTVKLDIPVGVKIVEYDESTGAVFDANTHELTLDWNKNRSPYVRITFQGRTTGIKKFSILGDDKIGSLNKYAHIKKGSIFGADEQIIVTHSDVRRWEESCFHLAIKTINEDGSAGFYVWVDGDNFTSNHLVGWQFDSALSSEGVVFNESLSTNNYIDFTVPPNQEVEIHITGCFLPKTTGDNHLAIQSDDTADTYYYPYTSLEPYRYVIDLLSHDIEFTNARLVSQIETGAYVYPVGVSEYDANLVNDKCSLRLTKFEDIDYIGCVPLKQTHFNPKSTFKDTLLSTTSKNKTYMGKKGVIDETITLNVRLPPRDVTTMQGLVDMDKPVPVDANHRCFEGDALNHRGWVELYSITTEETNPHWYKCELAVKYITHNLNTRFMINKGSRVSDYFLPELMVDTLEYGDDLTSKFFIETNGGYFYSSNQEDYHKRNMFALPNNKHFILRGMDRLSLKSQVSFNWYSTRNIENIHNNMSRIIRLIDAETNNAVVEYEYYDIDFSRTNEYNCRVICRVLHKGAYKTILNRNLILNSDVEFDASETGGIDVYGSELIFKIISDKLTIQDCGFSGKEIYVEDIDIQNGQYYFDVEFTNNNIENDAPDISNWVDVSIKELNISSNYSNFYKNILVSPFPVPDKTLVFSRESEEGTIFYFLDDGNETSYMVNPYYQYHCGVDLQNNEGTSIFNLNNNYKVVYITNGLIKLGINRYNGRMYLYKYDKYSKQYILTNQFQLTKYDDININSLSDDKIELQASDSIFTLWRGHPYVHISHPTEDILFSDVFTKIYSDGVGDKSSTIPMFYSLVDTTNLLPSCVASDRLIRGECLKFSVENISEVTSNSTVNILSDGQTANPTIISASHPSYKSMKFIIDGIVYDGKNNKIEYQFLDEGVHTIQAVFYNGDKYDWSNIYYHTVKNNGYRITPTFPDKMYYLQHDYTCILTYNGEPVKGETVVFYVNGLSYPKLTDKDGVARLNNRLSPKEQEDGQSQSSSYTTSNEPYLVSMTYSENGDIIASAEKECTIMKGYVNININSTIIKRGNNVIVTLVNNLDPNDDDITEDEIYVKGKSVVLSVNGRDYPRTTNNKGQCSLNIRLLAGLYDFKVIFAGDNQYNGSIKNFELRVNE